MSYRELHIQFRRATPKIFASYQTAIYYYDLVNGYLIDQEERTAIQLNTVTDRRNKCLVFVRSNNYKPGLNNLSNRLRTISNKIEKLWLGLSREVFKTKCKINLIQNGLSLL